MASLEQYATDQARNEGLDPSTPEVQAQINQVVTALRASAPGTPDDAIINAHQVAITPPAQSQATAAAPLPAQSSGDIYRQGMAQIQKDYGPEKEAALREQARTSNIGNEMARNISLSSRIASTPEARKTLDEAYAAATQKANQPFEDWQARKAQAQQEMEQKIKANDIDASDVAHQMQKLGLDQALAERATKEAILKAEGDYSSITSESMRKLAAQYSPQLVKQLGDRFNTMTAAQLKGYMPALEKQYLKTLDTAEKQADRTSREKIAAGSNQATLSAAQIRANATMNAAALKANAAGSGIAKIGDQLRADKQISDLDKQGRAIQDKSQAAQETIGLFDQAGSLIKNGLATGPIVGGDNVISKGYTFLSNNKQQADQLKAQLVASMAKTFGAAPSDKESALIREASNVFNQDNPGPALQQLKAKYERVVQQNQADLADIARQKNAVLSRVGNAPAPSAPKALPSVNAKGWRLMTDKSGNKAYVSPDGKNYEEIQ